MNSTNHSRSLHIKQLLKETSLHHAPLQRTKGGTFIKTNLRLQDLKNNLSNINSDLNIKNNLLLLFMRVLD